MKWKVKDREYNKARTWHKWFAWHPVHCELDDGNNQIWLEIIYRKQIDTGTHNIIDKIMLMPVYEYRATLFDVLKNPNTEEIENIFYYD